MQEQIRKAVEMIINDPDLCTTVEGQLAVIGILQKLIDTPGSRAVEEICHLRDLQGLPWPPVEELKRIEHEANEEAARIAREKELQAE